MKRIKIMHLTEYAYWEPVTLGTHRVLVRPREGHDVHIESSRFVISPQAGVRWIRDVYGNSIARLTFPNPSDRLSIFSEVVVQHFDENPLDFEIDPEANSYPFQYSMDEQLELSPFRIASYPRDGGMLRDWLLEFYKPGQLIGTFELLAKLNASILNSFEYVRRPASGVQSPAETLTSRSGSCRDFATLTMEAARHWGFGARFVTGYLQMPPDKEGHGATHAWTEIYIPGAGWRGLDPTNNKFAGTEHVSVAVARDPEKALPISGSWMGNRDAFRGMDVSVDVVEVY